MIDSYSRAQRAEQEGQSIPDTEAREAAEDIDSEEGPMAAEEAKKNHPLARTSLKGLHDLLLYAEEEAAQQGRELGTNHPVKLEIGRRERYLANRAGMTELHRTTLANASRLLIIDIEATCYDPTPMDADMDVIEVGGVLLDGQSLEILEEIQLYTKPTHTEVGEFCTKLTGITPEMVANAPSFVERMQELGQFVRDRRVDVWASFGAYDRKKISRQSLRDGVADPLENIPHINLKHLAGMEFGYGKFAPGLKTAITLAGLSHQGRLHSGLDDAKNIAAVLRSIVERRQFGDDIDVHDGAQARIRGPRM